MGPFLSFEINLDDDDHVNGVGKRLVEHSGLIDIGLDAISSRSLNQVFERNVLILDFGPIDTFASDWLLRSVIEKVERGIVAQLGH